MALSFVFCLGVAGCSGLREGAPVRPDADERKAVKADYDKALIDWTRGKKIYEGLDSRIYFNVTYKSVAFREAYAGRYAGEYRLEAEFKKSLLERELEEAERYNVFFMSAYTPDESWNDFERSGSVWRLYLEDDLGNRLSPLSVRKADSSDPILREFFPYFDIWSSGYVVRFPKHPPSGPEVPNRDTKFIKFVVTGVLGQGELVWEFKPSEAR